MKKLCIFLILLLACAQRTDEINPDKIELVYWSANNQYEINLARAIVAEWNQTHPEIQVLHQSIPESQSSEEVMLSAVVSKTTPDIYSNIWPGDTEFYVEANVLVALDRFPDFKQTIGQRVHADQLQEARSRDGQIYQIPWKTNPIMIIYNKKILAEAGYSTFPKTYSAYLTAAGKIAQDRNQDGYIDRWMGLLDIRAIWWQRFFDFYTLYIAASGGRTLVRQDQVLFDNQAAVDVFRFLQTNFQRGYFPKEKVTGRTDIFLQSAVATRFTGPYAITHADKFKPEDFEYDFAPVPRPDSAEGPDYTYGDFKNIVIFNNTKYPQAAWEFVKYMVNRKNDLKLLEMTNQLPVRQNILADTLFTRYFARNPRMVPFAKQARFVRGADSSPVLKEVFDAISQEFEISIVYGAKSPEQAIQDAVTRVKLIIK